MNLRFAVYNLRGLRDESLFWMESLADNNLVKDTRRRDLIKEGNEILSVMVFLSKTVRSFKECVNRKS